jgi:hypothetical protein
MSTALLHRPESFMIINVIIQTQRKLAFDLRLKGLTLLPVSKKPVLRIRIHRIRMFFGPDPLVGGMDPDPSIIKQK